MNREQFLETYGKVKVKFSRYYKYTFTFSGTLPDGSSVDVEVGGHADDIYRINVNVDQEISINLLDPTYIVVYKDRVEILSFRCD